MKDLQCGFGKCQLELSAREPKFTKPSEMMVSNRLYGIKYGESSAVQIQDMLWPLFLDQKVSPGLFYLP